MRMPTRTHARETERNIQYWIEVIECLDDRPRRVESLPHLYVGTTIVEPGASLDALWEKRRVKKPGLWGPIRYDLMDDVPFDSRADAKRYRRVVIDRLSRSGHTVNGDASVYRTYVLELDGARKPAHRGWLYVGQTSKSIPDRIAEHRSGRHLRHSRLVTEHFVSERPDLGDGVEYFTREDALLAESRLRVRLESLGFAVDGGQERLDLARKEN